MPVIGRADDDGELGLVAEWQQAPEVIWPWLARFCERWLRSALTGAGATLSREIAALDETFRAVLVLRDLDGLDYKQIGEVMDMPAGTVKSRLFRARLQLREKLEAMGYDGRE